MNMEHFPQRNQKEGNQNERHAPKVEELEAFLDAARERIVPGRLDPAKEVGLRETLQSVTEKES